MKEKKDPTILKAFLSLSLVLLFSSAITHAFPWPIKEKAGCPMKEIGINRPIEIRSRSTQEHYTNSRLRSSRALSTHLFFPPETWDPFPLSPVCNPYYKLLVLVT